MLIKRDCTAGRKSKSSKQDFISLVFQAAVFSLSTAGSRRERASRQEERLLMRCGGGSLNWGRYGSRYSFACYPEVGRLPDLEALTYLRDSVSHRAPFSPPTTTMLCHSLTVAAQSARSGRLSDRAQVASVLLRFVSGFASVHMRAVEMRSPCSRPVKGHVIQVCV